MNRLFSTLFSAFILSITLVNFTSCTDDGHLKLNDPTGINGMPSSFMFSDQSYNSFYYKDQKLDSIKYKNVEYCAIKYATGKLTGCSYHLLTPNDNTVRAITVTEPETDVLHVTKTLWDMKTTTDTIYLNSNQAPIRINEQKMDDDSFYYHIYSYDNAGRLIGQDYGRNYGAVDVYEKTYSYTYDTNPGSTSKVDCPIWFRIYLATFVGFSNTDTELLNYVNNYLTEHTYNKNDPTDTETLYSRSYTYGKSTFPNGTKEVLIPSYTINY